MRYLGSAFHVSYYGVSILDRLHRCKASNNHIYGQYCPNCRPRRTHADISISWEMTLQFLEILCAFPEK